MSLSTASGLSSRPRRAASLALTLALATGLAVPAAATVFAPQAVAVTAVPSTAPRPGAGEGTVSVDAVSYTATGTVTVSGTGFAAGNGLSIKLNDGAYRDTTGSDVIATVDVGADGTFSVQIPLAPFDLAEGTHWFRLLGSSPVVSKFVTFTVSADAPAASPSASPSAGTDPSASPSASPSAGTEPSTSPSASPTYPYTEGSTVHAGADYTIALAAGTSQVPGVTNEPGTVTGIETQVLRGLYQSAYSARDNAIYVTSAVGRPPVRNSALVKLNADTLEVIDYVLPAVDPTATDRSGNPVEGFRYAVYGVEVDDEHGTVWVTNTRQNTVAVYDAATLDLIKQLDKGIVGHPRDVIVDATRDRVYVGAARGNQIAVFDSTTYEQVATYTIGTGRDDFSVMSLAFDEAAGRLYTPSMSTSEVAVIDVTTGATNQLALPVALDAGSGIAVDPSTHRLYLTDQGTGSLTVVEADGSLVYSRPTAEGLTNADGQAVSSGALSVALDPLNKRVYVANRNAGTITVHDLDGNLLQTLDSGRYANHVEYDGRGNVYAVNKGGSRDGSSSVDYIQRFSVVAAQPTASPQPTSAPSSIDNGATTGPSADGKPQATVAVSVPAAATGRGGLARTGVSLGAGLLAVCLLGAGALLLTRRARA